GFDVNAYYPSHPDRVVIRKNKFLDSSLLEKDILTYYDKVKRLMIPFFKNRDVAIQIFADGNKTILKRHVSPKEKKYIEIRSIADFDKFNTGRAVAFYIGERTKNNYAIIDTDPGEGVNFITIKKLTVEVGNALNELDMFEDIDYLFTGKRGFHIWAWLKRSRDIDDIREGLEEFLNDYFKDSDKITITKKPRKGQVRMDISINKEAGLHICPLSLRFETGLVSWWVPEKKLMEFEKTNYTIERILKKVKKGG
ncbi:MAG: hypothetical protein QXU40_03870, partial [Candidatus Pacearchaeota archaeon]